MRGGGLNSYIIQGRGLRLSICATPARTWTKERRQQRAAVVAEIRNYIGQSASQSRGPNAANTWLTIWTLWGLSQIDTTSHSAGVNDNDQPCLS